MKFKQLTFVVYLIVVGTYWHSWCV